MFNRVTDFPFFVCDALFVLQEVLQFGVGLYALQLVGDNLPHFGTDAVVVLLNHLLHAVVAAGIGKVGDDGNRLVSLFLTLDLLGIDHNLAMENLLFDALVVVVGDGSHEHALRERGNLARRDKALHLRVNGGGLVLAVNGDALPPLENLAETLGKGLGGLAHDLTGKDVADGVHDHGGLLVAVVTLELGKVLKTQQGGNLVASGGGNQVVQPLEVNRGQLVDDDGGLQPALPVDELYDARVVQPQRRPVDILAVGIVADTENLRLVGIVDVERELTVGHDPVELRGNHARERNLRRGYLTGELFHRPALPGVHERGKVVLQFGIAGQNGKHVLVAAVEQLDGMGKGAILSVLIDAQKPYHCGEQDNRRLHEEVALFLHPRLVQIEHYRVGTLVGIGDVLHEIRMDWIAAVRTARVVEVDHVELRLDLVSVRVIQQVVVGDGGKVAELEV